MDEVETAEEQASLGEGDASLLSQQPDDAPAMVACNFGQGESGEAELILEKPVDDDSEAKAIAPEPEAAAPEAAGCESGASATSPSAPSAEQQADLAVGADEPPAREPEEPEEPARDPARSSVWAYDDPNGELEALRASEEAPAISEAPAALEAAPPEPVAAPPAPVPVEADAASTVPAVSADGAADFLFPAGTPPALAKPEDAVPPPEDAGVKPSTPGAVKGPDGKWQVATSYIDHRTADPNNREVRRGNAGEEAAVPGAGASTSTSATKKTDDGKWEVDTAYIKHRSGDPKLGRADGGGKSFNEPGSGQGAGSAGSATVSKESDGKWKVDTSYTNFRSADPNHIRKEEDKKNEATYADPEATKYAYEMLKGANQTRPNDCDPAKKEAYLSEAEFQSVFGAGMDEFAKMPKWKQQKLKKAVDLF